MRFEDERIIALRREEVKKRFDSVETGIYVGEVCHTFREYILFGGAFRIMLPDNLEEMEEEKAIRKYPSAFRPGVILADGSGLVNFTFTGFDQEASWDQLPSLMRQMQIAVRNMHPSALIFHQETARAGEREAPWFDFRCPTMEGDAYHFVHLSIAAGRAVLGMYNCPFRERKEWPRLFVRCLETARDLAERRQ